MRWTRRSGVRTLAYAAYDWSYAVLVRLLTTGDQIWADAGARAEIHAGSTALRFDQQTAFDVVYLDDNTTRLKVTQVTLSARVRALTFGQSVEVDTPNASENGSILQERKTKVKALLSTAGRLWQGVRRRLR